MALLESSPDSKNVKIEESLPYQVSIVNAVTVNNHMEYVIAIEQGMVKIFEKNCHFYIGQLKKISAEHQKLD